MLTTWVVNMLAEFVRRLRMLFRRKRFDPDLDEEMRLHRELRERKEIERGLSPKEARYAVQRRFGNELVLREESRDMWGWNWLENLLQDIRFGLRMLRKNPGFSMLVVGILALGIGATTSIFSLFDAVFLRPLPVRDPDTLVRMVQHRLKKGPPSSMFRYAYFKVLRDHAKTLATVFGETGQYSHFAMSDPEPAEEITMNGVTPEFFIALGVPALHGRVLLPDDANDRPGLLPAVLSYDFWQRRFRGDPAVVNKVTFLVKDHRFMIVGVMPREFNGISVDTAPDVRVPLRAYLLLAPYPMDQIGLELAGRLNAGVTRSQAEAECRVLWQSTMPSYLRDIEKLPPEVATRELAHGVEVETVTRGVSLIRNSYGDVLKLIMACIALLLLIVCTNVAGLLLERAATRREEIAVRVAVGATRLGLLRQVVAESVPLAALGAVGGLGVALAGTRLITREFPSIRSYPIPDLVPLSFDIGMNWRVFLFLLAVSILTMLLSSSSPALALCRTNLDSLLRGARSSSSVRGRWALIALQIALCTFLLVTASLFVRTLRQLQRVDLGFDVDHIATFTLNLNGDTGKNGVVLKTLTERVRSLPGVVSVGISSMGVMRGSGMATTVAPAGQRTTSDEYLNTSLNNVSPGYFDTMGMHILDGRGFTANDEPRPGHAGPTPAVVNRAFVEKFFPNVQPLGSRFGGGSPGESASEQYVIVGVVNDSKYRSRRAPIIPTFYTCATEFDQAVLNVRTNMRPRAILEPVRKTLAALAPGLAFLEVHTLTEEANISMAAERTTAALASAFGAIAALLAGAGIYGLLAYSVTERRREIGIRMALGAQPGQIRGLIVKQSLVITAVGVVLGLVSALIAGTGFRSLLYGISPQDPQSVAAALIFVGFTAGLATLLPVIRAMRVDPMVALRYE